MTGAAMNAAPTNGAPARRTLRRWAPAVVVLALTAVALSRYGVRVSDMARFCGYVVACLAVPGTLLVRALYRGDRSRAEEVALGLALGYALEVFAYVAARAVGAPLLVLAWPVATYAAFLLVPRLRRHWRSAPATARSPVWWSWSLALVVAYLVIWSAVNFFRTQALTWPALGASYPDMPLHLAFIGEMRHHVPPTMPIVAGESLPYHWFVYAHYAAASWVTGVEPLVLLFRLGMLPMIAALVVLLGMAARRVTGSRAAALIALAAVFLVAAPNLYLGSVGGALVWKPVQSWSSPTQTFGALLFVPVFLLLTDLLENRRRNPREWLLLGVFLAAVMGAKATYLPLLTAGLAAVAVVEAVRRRRPPGPALAAVGMSAAFLMYAQFVLYGGVRGGTTVAPLSLMRVTWGGVVGDGGPLEASVAAVCGLTLLCVLSGAVAWCGTLGLLSRPRTLTRPAVVLSLGLGLAGLGVALLFGHPGLSEIYFLQAPYPYLAIVSVYGLVVVTRRSGTSPLSMVCAAGAGAVAAYCVRILCDVRVPLPAGEPLGVLALPYAALLVFVGLTAVGLVAARRGGPRSFALTLAVTSAFAAPAAWFTRVLPVTYKAPVVAAEDAERGARAEAMPQGVVTAARWLRDHSRPGDVVATNLHCRLGVDGPCDSRAAWVSALTERRMLVEGWAYATANLDRWSPGQVLWYLPFWDRERLRANEALFAAPSAQAARSLRDRYGVRWLFVDERLTVPGARLGDVAAPRFRAGDFTVYEIAGPAVER
ncbi:hypothetical protein [Microbispora catharanthi]|uniref:Uncharacterized protein n=1 Tax=Microbispora catharanthi TaxID=1712871 RepID=A0A5N6C3A3_9ACTN|nr:hypothetical protein [Microbispora catharanthi]KAB8187237.1 hypothetical protein FH610_004770 [Microbispora catharanthi]